MRRLKGRSGGPQLAEPAADGVAVLDEEILYNARYTLFSEPTEDAEPSDSPVIVAETRVDVPDATVSDAVMMLDLRNIMSGIFTRAQEWEILPDTYANPMRRVKIGRRSAEVVRNASRTTGFGFPATGLCSHQSSPDRSGIPWRDSSRSIFQDIRSRDERDPPPHTPLARSTTLPSSQ